MNQVGDTVELMVGPIPSGSTIYSYVWDFWDGLSTATQAPFVVKVINIGGQPGTDELHYTCRPVAVDGQSVSLAGTLTANNPPTILPAIDERIKQILGRVGSAHLEHLATPRGQVRKPSVGEGHLAPSQASPNTRGSDTPVHESS